MTKFPELFASLAAPFDPNELKTRSGGGSRTLTYVTARTVMNRLDNVLGAENWRDDYTRHENSVLCKLSITLPDGMELTKQDAGGYAGMADSGDDDKSGYSDAFKRAAVKFGVGRYLYRDGVPEIAMSLHGGFPAPKPLPREPEHQEQRTQSPPHPSEHTKQKHEWPNAHRAPAGDPPPAENYGPPVTGKALFRWCKTEEERRGVGILNYLNGWAKLQDFPGRMIEWSSDQVAVAYAEGMRKLASTGGGSDPGDQDSEYAATYLGK